jgi:CHAT domain-containing protein
LHIATHFDLGTNFATSILLLGGGQNRELPLQTFLGWGDSQFGHVDLVCLSACDTAERVLEPASAGAEVTSFVDLTLKEGAQSVIASLWPVNDEATPMLMHSFYQNWLAHPEKGKGEALRQAQLGLLNGANGSGGATQRSPEGVGQATFTPDPKKPFSHPYYWAPFLLFGNWR